MTNDELDALLARLDGYNPPDRTIDEQRQIATDIADAAQAIRELQQRAEKAEAWAHLLLHDAARATAPSPAPTAASKDKQ
jgi:hypothetical protein